MTHLPTQLARKLINRTNARGLLAVAICGAATLAVTPASALADDDTASFWTQFAPSEDTRLIFVSSSEGNDNNSGFSPNEPVASLDKAYELLRDGYPDWMLLKRGDVWYSSFPRWKKSGRGVDEKMIVGAYGDSNDRPQVRPVGTANGLEGSGENGVRHLAFVGFHLEPKDSDSDMRGGAGLGWGSRTAKDILFEDLYISSFKTNVGIQEWNNGAVVEDIRLNGCVIVDAWNNSGHSQGMFAKGVDRLVVENSVFDHNGWNSATGAEPTIFNHNVYIQNGMNDVVFRNNISSNASSHGIQMRGGGTMVGNLFVSNPLSMHFGGGDNPDPGGVSAIVARNLAMYGRDITPGLPRGFGLTASNVREATIDSNYFHLSNAGYNHQAMQIGRSGLMTEHVTISNNTILGWHGTIQIQGEPSGPISIENNTVYRDLTHGGAGGTFSAPLVQLPDSWYESVDLRNNTYRHFDLHRHPFKTGGSTLQPDEWAAQVEPSATISPESTPPPSFGLDLYMTSIGLNGDWQDFIAHARSLSRTKSNDAYLAPSVINWFTQKISQLDANE